MNFFKMNLLSFGAGCNRTASIFTPNEKGMGIFGLIKIGGGLVSRPSQQEEAVVI